MRARRLIWLTSLGLATACVPGCKLAQAPDRDEIAREGLPETTRIRAEWAADAEDTGNADDGWIRSFDDPQLEALVDEAVANNPNLLLHEVVTVLRMPNILPHTLAAIAKDPRWKSNEQVRILIATHRNTPLATAEAVVSGLRAPALEKVLCAPSLQPALKAKLLRRK